MDKREEQFLFDLVALRMEEHYKREGKKGAAEKRLVDVVYVAEQEKKYEKLSEELTDEQREILEGYVEAINHEHARACDFYYKCGFKDGVKLMKEIFFNDLK